MKRSCATGAASFSLPRRSTGRSLPPMRDSPMLCAAWDGLQAKSDGATTRLRSGSIPSSCTRRADVWLQLSIAMMQKGDPYQSVSFAKVRLKLQPELAEAHSQLGVALSELRKHDEAIEAARRGVALRPDAADLHNNLGHVLHRAVDLAEAEAEIRRAIAIRPEVANFHVGLAAVLDQLDRVDESIAAAGDAGWCGVARAPEQHFRDGTAAARVSPCSGIRGPCAGDAAEPCALRTGVAGCAAVTGRLRERVRRIRMALAVRELHDRVRDFARPMWDGVADPRGRTIFIHTEQGFGDTIQFARYIPMLADRGEGDRGVSRIASHATPELAVRVVPAGLNPPDFDLHAAAHEPACARSARGSIRFPLKCLIFR